MPHSYTIANKQICRGIFHLRLKSAPDDFILLSPLDPEAEDSGLTRYMTTAKKSTWWFCTTCGVRCFTARAASEQAEVDVPLKSLQQLEIPGATDEADAGNVSRTPVWKLKKDGFAESPHGTSYFSLNAVTLDAGQDGLDLAVWHEKQWVQYVDSLGDRKRWQTGKPHPGGIY